MLAATKNRTITFVTVKEDQALGLRTHIFYSLLSRIRTVYTKRNTICTGSWR